ncbi:probable ATP-dependent RNA helicase DDX43 [Dendronephthya gigantea]|uniref:probable ATP-dependent RNA helicase DDX43 n=1 Tax=Dendronephthya gigantea TaxID=151771 RepID=UPI00106A943E|nr:probable ATP-dependent RNA helicase DDX43 [Dendronephthya gigantea]
MSDSGEDWDLEINSGVSKPMKWNDHSSESSTNSHNSGFSAPEKRFGRGRSARATNSWGSNDGSGNWRGNSDFDNALPRRPRRGFDSSSPAREERPPLSRGFGSRDRNGGVFGGSQDDGDSLRIEVSSRDVGKIIGRGGQSIKNIQNSSGAWIKILKDEADAVHTPIEISGSRDFQAKAKEMIDEIIFPQDLVTNKMEETSLKAGETPLVPRIDWAELRANRVANQAKKWEGLPVIKKVFYKESESVRRRSKEEVEIFRKENNNISVQNVGDDVQNRDIPKPVTTFDEAFKNYPVILNELKRVGFVKPTPIQCQSWSVLLSGLNLIGIAQTGTGKTLAFLLPALIHIAGQERTPATPDGPNVLVLSPTRELALQIETEVNKLHYKGIRSVCVYGGSDRRAQIDTVKSGVEIVIGTPGRLNDLIMNEILPVKSVTYLVLDEADRMLDMGFEPEIRKILIDIRPDRQTVMTSATWPSAVRRMASQYVENPVQVNVGSLDLAACHTVTQIVEIMDGEAKKERTLDFINSMGPEDKVLIFVGRKLTADDVASDFMLKYVSAGIQCIHGDREQCDREQALDDFKTGRVRVLIATDVASRGLDIKGVTHVINYDFPRAIEDYVHRIGRTGRAGSKGSSLSFITREDWKQAQNLIYILEEANQEVSEELRSMAERYQAWRERNAERGDRRNGGGGDGCFKCGEHGHFSRECPQGGGSRGSRGGNRGRGGRGGSRRGRGGGMSFDMW